MGTENPYDAKFCMNCGEDLKEAVNTVKPEKKSKKKSNWWNRRSSGGKAITLIVIILCILLLPVLLVGGSYYFLVYSPYQHQIQEAKTMKINEVNTYFKGPLAVLPEKQMLIAQINEAKTRDDVLAVDVMGPATQSWRLYQNQQISSKKDSLGRVNITYTNNSQKTVTLSEADAQKLVNESDADVLVNLEIKTP